MPILHRRSEQSGHRHRIGKISQRLFGTTVTQKEVTTTTGPVLAGMKNIRFLRPQERLYCFLTTKTCVARINISNNNYSIRLITIQQQSHSRDAPFSVATMRFRREEPPPHSGELNHALSLVGATTQPQLSRPMSSGHHICMEHRLRRKPPLMRVDNLARMRCGHWRCHCGPPLDYLYIQQG